MRMILLAAIAATMTCVSASAQLPGTGAYPFASFDNRGFDSINLGNDNIRFSIPIVNRTGRGLGFSYAIQYEGLIWNPVNNGSTTVWTPDPAWGFTGALNGSVFAGYLTYMTRPGKCEYGNVLHTVISTSGYVYHDFAGGAHPLNYSTSPVCNPNTPPSYSTSGNGAATDDSGYTLVGSPAAGYQIQARNGALITPATGETTTSATSEVDSNGNSISFNGSGTFTDTSGVNALTISGSSPVTFTYPVALQANGATTASASLSYKSYTVRTNFQVSGVVEYGSNTVNLVDRITLADGSFYAFGYEGTPGATDGAVTARIASVTLPTGGTISYAYQYGWPGSINTDGTPAGLTRTTSDGSKQYNRNYSQYPVTTEYVLDEKGNETDLNFIADTNGNTYETGRWVYQGANNSGSVALLTKTTAYNGQAPTAELTGTITEADVTSSYNGGSQNLTKNSFDAYGNLSNTAQYSGSILLQNTALVYNSFSKVTSSTTTDGAGNSLSSSSFGYDETGVTPTSGIPQHTTSSGNGGNQTSAHIWTGTSTLTTTTAFYDTGMPVSQTTPNGTTSYSYDSTGTFVTQTTLPTPSSGVGLSTSATYDTNSGALLTSTGMNSGQTTTINQYDALLRLVGLTPPSGGFKNYTYNPTYAQVEQTLNSSTGQRTFSAVQTDAYGRLSRSITGTGQSSNPGYETDTCYDAAGMAHFVTTLYASQGFGPAIQCQGSGTTYQYDALGRITSVTTSDGTATTQYQNRAVKTTDVNGVQHIRQYDLLGRLSAVCEVSGSNLGDQIPGACNTDIAATGYLTTYNYSYNSTNAANVLTVSQGPQQRVFQSDLVGRPLFASEPERGATTYSYSYTNGAGLQVVRKRPRANQSNASTLTTTTSQYDSLGRLASVSYDDGLTPSKNYFYDIAAPGQQWSQSPSNPKGMLVATSSGSGTSLTESQFSYDLSGNVVALLQCAPSICNTSAQSSRSLGFGYDLGANLTSSSDAAAGLISYARSTAGEVTSITNNTYHDSYNPASLVSNVVNTPFGPSSYALGNGVQSVHTYDGMGRSSGNFACTGSSSPQCANGSQLWGSTTIFSGSRLIQDCDTMLNECENTGYDEFNRLISTTDLTGNSGDIGSYSFTYDRWGNRLSQTSQSGGPSPAAPVSDTTNQISGIPYDAAGNMESDRISHTFTYDAEGKVIAVDGGNTATYVYDALNHRVSVQTSSGTNEFTFDPFNRRISTWAAANNFGIEGRIYWDGMQIAYRGFSGQTYFQHKDYLGTNRIRTNYQGAVAATESSLAFGDGFKQNILIAGSDQDNDQFAGQEKDAESSSEHAQFRQYSSLQGRWMSPDPYDGSYRLGNPQSFNRYAYALNNPLSSADPLGLDGDCEDDDGASPECAQALSGGGGDGLGGGDGSGLPSTSDSTTVTADPFDDCSECLEGYFGNQTLDFGEQPSVPTISAPNNAPTPNPCQVTLLNMANQQLGTNFNSSNIAGSYTNGTAYNIIIQSNQLTSAQFNNIQLGRYTTSGWQYFTGAGLAGHIADETNLGFAQSVFQSSNIGGNLSVSFAFHDDHGYANNPIGALIHFLTDVLGHNSRKPC